MSATRRREQRRNIPAAVAVLGENLPRTGRERRTAFGVDQGDVDGTETVRRRAHGVGNVLEPVAELNRGQRAMIDYLLDRPLFVPWALDIR